MPRSESVRAAVIAAGLQWRNLGWAVGPGWSGAYRAGRAMRRFLSDHRECAWCGRPATVVHHPTPVHIMPDAADDPENMVSSCRVCHLRVWHAGSWRRWASGLASVVNRGEVRVLP